MLIVLIKDDLINSEQYIHLIYTDTHKNQASIHQDQAHDKNDNMIKC